MSQLSKRMKSFPFKQFILACFVFSFLFSLLLLFGKIEDFFSYYYVGRAIVWGRDMFADVAEDKGPVSYLFFAALYQVFGSHYTIAIIVASVLLDAVFCIIVFSLLQRWIPFSLPKRSVFAVGMAFLLIAYTKSFSIGMLAGGVYTEQIAMITLMASFWLLEKHKYALSGILFALAIFSRQSVFGFILVTLICLAKTDRPVKNIVRFSFFAVLTSVSFLCVFWWKGSLPYLWENMVESVMHYRVATGSYWQQALFYTFSQQIRIPLTLLFIIVFFLRFRKKLAQTNNLAMFFSLLLGSMLSVFSGGLVWGHHFLQWVPLFFFCMLWQWRYAAKEYAWLGIYVCVFSAVFLAYIGYFRSGIILGADLQNVWPRVKEIEQKRYIVVLGDPKLYIDVEKEAPDRYYNARAWLQPAYYGSWSQVAISRHKNLPVDRVRDTAFIFVSSRDTQDNPYQWYLDTFGSTFMLHKQTTYIVGPTRMEVYISK